MIYISGDIHGNPWRFSNDIFPEQKEMCKEEDFVVVLGDFGLVWNQDGESEIERKWLDWLEKKPFTTLFIDGNHECFDRLYQYPVEEWKGGRVHKIRPHVIHLMRGEVFSICNRTIFAFGGAASHDIDDGVLDKEKDADKIREWRKDYTKMFRINHLSWWEQELPSQEEMDNGLVNLERVQNQVDFIFTHSPSASTIAIAGGGNYKQDRLTWYLEEIKRKVDYKKWFMGHLHKNQQINDKEIVIYEQIIRIA